MWKGKGLRKKKPDGFMTTPAMNEARIEIFWLFHNSTSNIGPKAFVELLNYLIKQSPPDFQWNLGPKCGRVTLYEGRFRRHTRGK